MRIRRPITDYIRMADIQAKRLSVAVEKLRNLFPISPNDLASLDETKLAFLDMLTTRLSKLQDIIGSRVFPLLLESLSEEAPAFIDKLNKLEKLHYLESASWWLELKDLRNQITHEYPDDSLLCEHLNLCIPKAQELLIFWKNLKNKLAKLN